MQKTTRKASILIWTIFLSIIISMAFLGISTKIHKNIKNSGEFITGLDHSNEIDSFIKQVSESKAFNNTNFGESISIEFEDLDDMQRSLKSGESTQFQFTKTGSINTSIQILSGGPLAYKYSAGSGIITDETVINFTLNDGENESIQIKGLGGNTTYQITSNKTFLAPETKYTIYRKIGNLKSIQTKGAIYNFPPGAF